MPHWARFFSMGAKSQATRRMQKSSPLLRSAARTPRAADDAETASSHSRSCSTAGDLHRIAPPPHLPSFLFVSLALQVREFIYFTARWKFARIYGRSSISVQIWEDAPVFSQRRLRLEKKKRLQKSKWAVWIWEQNWVEQWRLDGAKVVAFMTVVTEAPVCWNFSWYLC